MLAPKKVDYPTDDDSDDNVGFSIKVRTSIKPSIGVLMSIQVPELADLLNEFEKDDDVLYKEAEATR